jgi:acetylornithine deacetylase/succinyl-diaminopimelate desuccinylase-like protein
VKFEITFEGRVAHISRAEEGADALAAAVDVHRALRDLTFTHTPHPDLPQLPRLLVGVLNGGYAPAGVADRALLQGDIRTVPSQTWSSIRDDLEQVVRDHCPPDVTPKVRCLVRQRSFAGPRSGALMDALSAAHQQVRGAPAMVDLDPGAQCFVTDAVDMAQAGIETLVYGPAAWHFAPDEYIDIDEMVDASRVYLAAAANLMAVN